MFGNAQSDDPGRLSPRSTRRGESLPVILGREFGQKMQAMFARDLAASQAIDPERGERRPPSFRFKEWMARVWGRLL